ncbi:MAG: imidazole glycerol phosphate synthase subunit HisH [Planctomycetaceae bacterium]|jgi:glutamine amidotransferase|nr:imidazole glycerol phosphate synthase subunit HisH [Planctomycetaceae bacterium]
MPQKLAIVDFGAGNLTSVRLALRTIGADGIVTSDPQIVAAADRIIFPGVGAAGAAMVNLRRTGLDAALRYAVQAETPLLGICVGMQVLLDFSEEDGGTEMLGLLPGNVVKFQPANRWDKVPQIGWNSVSWSEENAADPFLKGISNGSDFYFVHSFYPVPENPVNILATTEYAGISFASLLRCKNIVAAQFHPEKSGKTGLNLLANFISRSYG